MRINMIITSTQFENNGWMPDSIAGYGEDVSPDIDIEGLPEDTVSLAVTMSRSRED